MKYQDGEYKERFISRIRLPPYDNEPSLITIIILSITVFVTAVFIIVTIAESLSPPQPITTPDFIINTGQQIFVSYFSVIYLFMLIVPLIVIAGMFYWLLSDGVS